uniref:Uncharacterized protein n=1 Tax=Zea mays TaxID=4577 RepID=A0A804NEA2_MAIZE
MDESAPRNERPRIVDGPTERVSPLSANTSRTRPSIGSSGNRKQQERRRRGEARLRRPGSGSFVVTAVSPRRDGALLDARASGTPGKQVGTRAGRHSAQRKRKRRREVPVRLSPREVPVSPGPCIHHPLPLAPARSWFGRSAVPRLRHVAPRRSTRLCRASSSPPDSSPQTGALSQAPTTVNNAAPPPVSFAEGRRQGDIARYSRSPQASTAVRG